MDKITDVIIVGGTHGNEKTGVNIVRYLKTNWICPFLTFKIQCVEGNPHAIDSNQRYINFDLNRSVNQTQMPTDSYEKTRVEELKSLVKNPASTFVIDLHTTTSNMGITWIFSKKDLFSRRIGYKAAGEFNHSYILETKELDEKTNYVNGIADHGLMIEVGPVAQNLAIAKAYNDTKAAVMQILQAIEIFNQKGTIDYSFKMPYYYKEVGVIDYPRGEKGDMTAMIHPDLQGQDYQQLAEKPAFQTFDGTPRAAEHVKRYYPVFVNEAAYYEKGIAFMYCDKKPIKHFFEAGL
jgi:aspartoacylase